MKKYYFTFFFSGILIFVSNFLVGIAEDDLVPENTLPDYVEYR